MKVPFLDLRSQHCEIRDEIRAAIDAVIDSSAFAGGPFVEEFESDFARYCECPYAIGLGNGTDALWLSLLALGVGPGDEVITVPNSFMATAEAITYCGAKPVFVDVDETTYTMDPSGLEDVLTDRTKAVIPVHLFGQPTDMDPILEFAREHNLAVIEDACQAHGAEYKGRRVGSIGDAGCFSFYPGKNLGAMGEAGAVVTTNPELDEKIRVLRDHGQIRKYHHRMVGWNCRMDGIQGAVLRIKLRYLDRGNECRRALARQYDRAFLGMDGVIVPEEADHVRHVYHVYALRVQDRDTILQELKSNGIDCGIHYPVPIHLQEAYQTLGYTTGDFPVAETCAREFLSLPMFPELRKEQAERVITAVREATTAIA